jgi:4-hydroxybenzoate polyprenyltransferase
MVCAILYTKKKLNRFFGYTSSVWRGFQSAFIAFAFMPRLVILAFVLAAVRNLIGDFRDIGDDWNDGARTLPTLFGFRRNQKWAFWGHLGAVITTTVIWFQFTDLGIIFLIFCIFVQIISYPLTPRQSNPPYLMFC